MNQLQSPTRNPNDELYPAQVDDGFRLPSCQGRECDVTHMHTFRLDEYDLHNGFIKWRACHGKACDLPHHHTFNKDDFVSVEFVTDPSKAEKVVKHQCKPS